MGFDPAGLVESLPRDPAVIEATRQNVAGPWSAGNPGKLASDWEFLVTRMGPAGSNEAH